MKRLFIICLLVFSQSLSSAELNATTYWEGIKSSFSYFYQGSYMQFTAQNNLYWAAGATPALWYSFEEDKRISNNARKKHIPKYMQLSSDFAPVLSFPIIPIAFFAYGIKHDDNKAVEFAKETFATLYLALLESAAISAVHIHERPDQKKLSKMETAFRGSSSFPSGHVVPYAAMTLKTLQFYGPYYAAVPAALFVATSIQRVRDGKHYLSDVVGGFFLTAFAAEGVRKAANNNSTHAAYKSLFDQDFKIGYTEFKGVIGPQVSLVW
jgi:membrane-associated phospholipid phosphatase